MFMIDLQETGDVKPIFLQIGFWDSRSSSNVIQCLQ